MSEKIYTLMHKRVAVVDFVLDDGDIIAIRDAHNIKHLPVGVESYEGKPVRSSLNKWWQNRGIPISRSGLKEGLEILGVSHQKELMDKSYGLSLSDQYWISPKDSQMQWDKMNFFDNNFSDDVGDALFGTPLTKEDIDYLSPCSASDGWLKKKWKIIHGERFLIKSGSGTVLQEPYNEVIATALHRRFNVAPFTTYDLIYVNGTPYSICKDFITANTELVSAAQMLNSQKRRNDVSYYSHLLNLCKQNGINQVQAFLDYLITTDYIIANTDRHFNNFGFIRNADTLEYEGVAPIYDSGTSLWFDKADKQIDFSEAIQAKPFKKTQAEQIKLVKRFDWLDISKLAGFEEEVSEILKKADTITPERRERLCLGIKNQIKALDQIACEQQHSNTQ